MPSRTNFVIHIWYIRRVLLCVCVWGTYWHFCIVVPLSMISRTFINRAPFRSYRLFASHFNAFQIRNVVVTVLFWMPTRTLIVNSLFYERFIQCTLVSIEKIISRRICIVKSFPNYQSYRVSIRNNRRHIHTNTGSDFLRRQSIAMVYMNTRRRKKVFEVNGAIKLLPRVWFI